MKINFSKYQGAGNDFVMIDNMIGEYDGLSIEEIRYLCDRRKGIGADGLILLCNSDTQQFKVDYYNADGSQSFCGNGARCSTIFAREIGLIETQAEFEAIDGVHKSEEMLPVNGINQEGEDYILETGSPHYVKIVDENRPDIIELGRSIRYSDKYKTTGINVNTVVVRSDTEIDVETYERGVEDETLSCGTGVTACALVQMKKINTPSQIKVHTKGGDLSVEAEFNGDGFSNIWLTGPAEKVFDGSIAL